MRVPLIVLTPPHLYKLSIKNCLKSSEWILFPANLSSIITYLHPQSPQFLKPFVIDHVENHRKERCIQNSGWEEHVTCLFTKGFSTDSPRSRSLGVSRFSGQRGAAGVFPCPPIWETEVLLRHWFHVALMPSDCWGGLMHVDLTSDPEGWLQGLCTWFRRGKFHF